MNTTDKKNFWRSCLRPDGHVHEGHELAVHFFEVYGIPAHAQMIKRIEEHRSQPIIFPEAKACSPKSALLLMLLAGLTKYGCNDRFIIPDVFCVGGHISSALPLSNMKRVIEEQYENPDYAFSWTEAAMIVALLSLRVQKKVCSFKEIHIIPLSQEAIRPIDRRRAMCLVLASSRSLAYLNAYMVPSIVALNERSQCGGSYSIGVYHKSASLSDSREEE